MEQTVKMTVHYIDGTHQTFAWEPQSHAERSWNEVSEMKKSLQEAHLLLKTEAGGLIIIPRDNIKYIEVSAAPDKVPPNTILGVRLIDG